MKNWYSNCYYWSLGVGKTFWKKFIEKNNFKRKYIYVSLFGLQSLSDLKTHIYSNIENNHSTLEVPRWIRGLPAILKIQGFHTLV